MRRIRESGAVLDAIAAASGAPRERVAVVVTALRDAIDGLFLDGYTIFAPPFSLAYPDDPVAPVFAERVENANADDAEAWRVGDLDAAAEWLGIPAAEYKRHPVASTLMVLVELFDGLDIEDADSPEGVEAVAIAEAWFDTYDDERPYQLSTVGLERDLEAWLIHHPERLGLVGYDVRLRHQQLVLPDRRRPDLVFDLIEPDGSTGTLIVELKATSGYLEAVDQLVGYMDALTSLGRVDGVLRGLLVADGFPPAVLPYADERGIDTATLSELGYRRDLAALTTSKPSPRTPSTESETSMKKFVGLTVNQYDEDDKGKPVIVFNAKSVQDPPESIEPYDDSLEARQMAAQWSSFIAGPGRGHSVTQLAMSLGGIIYADGSPIESA